MSLLEDPRIVTTFVNVFFGLVTFQFMVGFLQMFAEVIMENKGGSDDITYITYGLHDELADHQIRDAYYARLRRDQKFNDGILSRLRKARSYLPITTLWKKNKFIRKSGSSSDRSLTKYSREALVYDYTGTPRAFEDFQIENRESLLTSSIVCGQK